MPFSDASWASRLADESGVLVFAEKTRHLRVIVGIGGVTASMTHRCGVSVRRPDRDVEVAVPVAHVERLAQNARWAAHHAAGLPSGRYLFGQGDWRRVLRP
jgi:hypothetical protein